MKIIEKSSHKVKKLWKAAQAEKRKVQRAEYAERYLSAPENAVKMHP